MMNKFLYPVVILICTCLSMASHAATYYVSFTAGNDTYNGTSLATPFKTIQKAVAVAFAGDIIYLRGEVHYYSARINISKSGTAASRFQLLAYPGDVSRPILDFSAMAINSSNRGVDLSGNYWNMKGFDIYKAGDNGLHVSGSNNIFEFMSFYENADTGLQLDNGASNNQIINCDSYYNVDPSHGNADGFAVKLNVGTGNSFKGCRAWQNSDDGWDGLLTAGLGTNPSTTYDSNWCFLNGYLKDMTASTGNGNGFKMGGNNELHDVTLRNCLAVANRVKGFDQNNNNGSMIVYNCTAYRNGRNFGMNNNAPSAGEVMIIKNCVSYLTLNTDVFYSGSTRTHNSWQGFTVDATDFVSLDTSVLRAPRNADGSLPNINLLKLSQGSDLIDAGTNVGLPYNGSNPDIGYAESNYPLPVAMLSFTGSVKNGLILLEWSTATEANNHGWEVERYIPTTIAWQKVGFVQGKNNSNNILHYSFTDNKPLNTPTGQYRLKQVDKDGTYRYSNVITIRFSKDGNNELNFFPNPARNYITAKIQLRNAAELNITVYNSLGQIVKTIKAGRFPGGEQMITINTTALPAGQYILLMQANDDVYKGSFIKPN